MATYNGAKYLKDQLDSILSQTYKNIEIIIVDDCSTDDRTIQILKEYQQLNPRLIKLIQNTVNLGVIKTFERAITYCTGDFIALADQDDIWEPNKIQILMDEIGDNLLIHSDAILIDIDGNIMSSSYMLEYKSTEIKTFTDYLNRNNVTGCTVLLSRELVDLALPIPTKHVLHDYYFAIIASYFKRIKYLDVPLISYRQHAGNTVGASPKLSFEDVVEYCRNIALDYNRLLELPIFKDNNYIKLFRDFRLGIVNGRWHSSFGLFQFLKIRGGVRCIIYFYVMTGFGSRRLANFLYNKIRKIN